MKKLPTASNDSPGAARIFTIRGKKVILDSDLAGLYGVPTKQLNQQIRRNPARFPADFAFQVSESEWQSLRSQIVTLKKGRGSHRKFLPYVLTEHGALMAAAVLNSRRAIDVSIHVVRTFVAMREAVANTAELAKRLDELEASLERRLASQDATISEILAAIRSLMDHAAPPRRAIGFITPTETKPKGAGGRAYRVAAATRDVRHLKGLVPKPAKPVSVEAMKRAAARSGSRR